MSTAIKRKTDHIFTLMEKMAAGEELYAQNERLHDELGLEGTREAKERKIRRYLEDIHDLYGHIVVTEKRRKEFGDRKVTVYRVVDRERDVAEVFRRFIEHHDDLSWLLQVVREHNPRLLSGERKRFERLLKEEEDIFLFIGSPFETFEEGRSKEIFRQLKTAVKNREYRDIFKCTGAVEKSVKCLKLIHMADNWYLAGETEEGRFRLFRVAFIERVGYSKNRIGYQPKILDKYAHVFASLQNPMTLDRPFETARMVASAEVAYYFKEGMKPFFPTQKFLKELEDGSVEFTVSFTQPMEILPFVKQWLPHISIISPEKLKIELEKDIRSALETMEK
ncbi:hypothetical protein NNO_2062 [Hydrogenimonas sp.]|nr:hypothetical protein NNO_2062 [Hydrogenimonas sp.]